MKRLLSLFIVCILSTVYAFAIDWTDENGVTWTYTINDFTKDNSDVIRGARISKASGIGSIVIVPEVLGDDIPVCALDNSLFSGNATLIKVMLPSSLLVIGNSVFDGCSSLTSVNLPDGLLSIGSSAFSNCTSLTSIKIPESVKTLGSSMFNVCKNLKEANIPKHITAIPGTFFYMCKSLEQIEIPSGVSEIGSAAFYSTGLKSVCIPEGVTSIPSLCFYVCESLESISLPSTLSSISSNSFSSCRKLRKVSVPDLANWCNIAGVKYFTEETPQDKVLYVNGEPCNSIVIPTNTTAIYESAFYGFSNIEHITVPENVQEIGSHAFAYTDAIIELAAKTPVPIDESFTNSSTIVVPTEAYDVYVSEWEQYENQIVKADLYDYVANVTANDEASTLHKNIGENNLKHIVQLKIIGSINGYDIMLLRNKMINLHYLDLSNATIVGNDYEYYTGYHTTDNEIGPYAFYNLPNLYSVKLPEVTAIGGHAFSKCTNLKEINIPKSTTFIGSYAFSGCSALLCIEIPSGVTTINTYAFQSCFGLKQVTFNEGLKTIGSYAFDGCKIADIRFPESLQTINTYAFRGNSFKTLNLPPNLNTIDQYAFSSCPNLQVVRLNPMLKNISDYAFNGCSALKKVYSYTLEPTDILQDTYSNYKAINIYVPTPSYYTYYYNTQWSQFLSVNCSDEEYDFKSFYIEKDYIMDDETGNLGGDPDGELGDNSGLIHNGSETQALGTVTMRFNGNNGSASIIANGNLTAEKIKVEITITGNKWHFFCFPFDVPLSGVSVSGNKAYVFRHYNAEKRATGASGWEDLPVGQDHLIAGEGYIFQANGNSTLTVEVDNKTTFVGQNVAVALHVQDAANVANASWNFKGNPGYAYFDIDDLGFSAPITVWDPNTNNYVALRPGDDDAFLHPFQAFFVQKYEDDIDPLFSVDARKTYLEMQKIMTRKAESRRRALANVANNPRKLVNISVTDGTNTDNTRVVFNDKKSMAYEMDCDAAKFAATGVPQLYSIGNDDTHYAINERPNGDGTVRLGFTADKAGDFSIEAGRMDTPCYLRDLETGYTHDFNDGAYEFTSAQGTFENRFLLVNVLIAEGIETFELDSIAADAVIYDLQGRRIERAQQGIFVVNGKKVNVK